MRMARFCLVYLIQLIFVCFTKTAGQPMPLLTSIKEQPTLYTVKVGATVNLPCEIENRRTSTVIWQFSKSRIPETLTIGYFYYRKDFRIRVVTNTTYESDQSWNLEIRKVKLDDEGYYLCKVMSEPDSLKRTLFLKVEVDLTLTPVNPVVSWNMPLTLFCNTSFVKEQSDMTAYRTFKRNLNHARIIWFKDGVRIHNDGYNHKNNTKSHHERNLTIYHYTEPTVSSSIRIHSISPDSVGKYTCKFRYQNITTIVIDQEAYVRNLEVQSSSSDSLRSSFSLIPLAVCFIVLARKILL